MLKPALRPPMRAPMRSANSPREGVGGSLASLLFGNGEDGFLFGDWSELDELFTLSTGLPNVLADSDPVGLAMDDHSWGVSTLALIIAAQAELITNGTFDANISGWTAGVLGSATAAGWDAGGGGRAATTRVDASNYSYLRTNFATVIGRTYCLTMDVSDTSHYASLGTADFGTQLFAGPLTISGGRATLYFVAASTTTYLLTRNLNVGTQYLDNVSVKLVPGNHALQATGTQRPLWRANSGKPYLSWDGSDDVLRSMIIPATAGALFFAGNPVTTGTIIGSSDAASANRCAIQINSNGQLGGGIGAVNNLTIRGSTDVRGTNVVGVLTWNGSLVELWQSGTKVYSDVQSGAPTVAQPLFIGGVNAGGSPVSWLQHSLFAAGYLNRKPTDAEIARITSDFQRTYQ